MDAVEKNKTWAPARCRMTVAAVALAALAACGGGGGGGGSSGPGEQPLDVPASREEAARFLTQATFGPTDAQVDSVMNAGYGAWLDAQLARRSSRTHRENWEDADKDIRADDPDRRAWQREVVDSFWRKALKGDDAVRQRVAYALSQIFVVSMLDQSVGDNPRAVADYMDMLADKGLGNYRDLIEAVSLHPMMGTYLSSIRNQKENAQTGRVPDENYAREVMQLFTIGLHELNQDGTEKTDAGGSPIDTYGPADIAGLARVFTGWSWDCPDFPSSSCFYSGAKDGDSYASRSFRQMVGYPDFHSPEEKKFLGTTIPAQSPANPKATLKTALDTLANHPNVGPFIGKQLIQRLVTSNPSPAYVSAVAAAFANNGAGVRGDMKAVVKAVLLHPEARSLSATHGKLREPVLRLSAFLRAFPVSSDSGQYRVDMTDNPGTQLGQTPMRSPSVFNFYRPGYIPPGTAAAAAGLASPEMQIAHETTAAGYVNYMRDAVQSGVGVWSNSRKRRDVQVSYAAEIVLATQPAQLVDRLDAKLMYGTMPPALKQEIVQAVGKIVIPVRNSNGSNQQWIDQQKRNRVRAAVLLTLVSPEFVVQK